MSLLDLNSEVLLFEENFTLNTSKEYYWEPEIKRGKYLMRACLEGCFAHESVVDLNRPLK